MNSTSGHASFVPGLSMYKGRLGMNGDVTKCPILYRPLHFLWMLHSLDDMSHGQCVITCTVPYLATLNITRRNKRKGAPAPNVRTLSPEASVRGQPFGSGQIAQGHIVQATYRHRNNESQKKCGRGRFVIASHEHGRTQKSFGTMFLTFYLPSFTFESRGITSLSHWRHVH
jgi:hypothetical protein